MKKILLILCLFPILVFSQKSYKIPADSTILNNIGSGKNELVIRNATSNITGGVLTNLGNGVTAFVLGGGSARVVDTIYKNNTKDSIVFTISGIRYAVKDSFNLNTDSQTLSISNDTLTISGGNSVILPVYIQIDSATITSYDVLNSQNAPPGSPATGDTYLVGTSPSGAWVGHAKDIAEWNGSSWDFTDGVQGDFLYNATNALTYIFRSGNWVQTTGIPALNNGNTISSGLRIGTNNARSLKFETANLERGRIDSLGRYYIYDTSLRYSNKYIQVDSLTGRLIATEIPYNDGFIPISGTEFGSPVTGDIEFEFDTDRNIISHSEDFTFSSSVSYSAGSLNLGGVRPEGNADIQINSAGNGNILIGSSDRGLVGNDDYSANITDLDYTQKKYVDTRISDTANVLRGLIPNVSNFATITNLADTSTALRSLISAKVSTTTLTDSLEKKTNKLISFNTYTTSDTLRLSDADKVIEMNVGTANNLVIPNYSDYAFPVGTQITVIQIGSGQTTFVPASGVTISSAGGKLKLTGQYSTASLIKRSNTLWYLFGDITN